MQEGRASPADVACKRMQNSAGKCDLWANLASLKGKIAWLTQASYECAICSVSVCVACCLFLARQKCDANWLCPSITAVGGQMLPLQLDACLRRLLIADHARMHTSVEFKTK